MKNILIFILIIHSWIACSQNIVQNSDFEMPSYLCWGGVSYNVPYWYDPVAFGGPNYCNPCVQIDPLNPYQTFNQTPYNSGGFCIPHSGESYLRLAYYSNENYSGNYIKEFVATKLKTTLIKDRTYCIEYYVQLDDSSRIAIDKLQISFSQDSTYYQYNSSNLPLVPYFTNPNGVIKDTANWVKIAGSITATGNEKYMHMGTFSPHNQITVDTIPETGIQPQLFDYAHYYIDDVYLYDCDAMQAHSGNDTSICPNDSVRLGIYNYTDIKYAWYNEQGALVDTNAYYWASPTQNTYYVLKTINFKTETSYDTTYITIKNCDTIKPIEPIIKSITLPNAFTPNADGVNDVFRPKESNFKSLDAQIINRWGNKIYSWNKTDGYWNGKTKDGTMCSSGTYFYVITVTFADGSVETRTGSVTLANGER